MKNILIFCSIFSYLMSLKVHALEVHSFNVGLAHTYVPYAKERIPHLLKAIKSSTADVLCLQEVWRQEDRDLFANELKSMFPHQLTKKIKQTKSQNTPTCRIKELFGKDKLVTCMQKQCKGLKGDHHTDCVLTKCGHSLDNLRKSDRECATALMAQVGKSPLKVILTVLNIFKPAGLFTYGGSDGLMLLSKRPLQNAKLLDFSDISTLSRRVTIKSSVAVKGSQIDILCTHLTAELTGEIPYSGKFASWEEENFQQVERMLEYLKTQPNPQVLLGDFNCSRENQQANLAPIMANSCQRIVDEGFLDPLVEVQQPLCTFCQHNTLTSTNRDSLIDHVFIKDLTYSGAQRTFTQLIDFKSANKSVKSHLSDHFGVKLIIE